MVVVEARRKAIESLYDGVCNVIEYQKSKDTNSKMMKYQEVTILEEQPCRVSFSTISTVVLKDEANSVSQTIKLFIAPEVSIKPGSKIVVMQNGVTTAYKSSGQSAMYSTHQEIILELFEDWA